MRLVASIWSRPVNTADLIKVAGVRPGLILVAVLLFAPSVSPSLSTTEFRPLLCIDDAASAEHMHIILHTIAALPLFVESASQTGC